MSPDERLAHLKAKTLKTHQEGLARYGSDWISLIHDATATMYFRRGWLTGFLCGSSLGILGILLLQKIFS